MAYSGMFRPASHVKAPTSCTGRTGLYFQDLLTEFTKSLDMGYLLKVEEHKSELTIARAFHKDGSEFYDSVQT